MKKFLGIILLMFAVVFASAQSTTPRFGNAKNQDNTGRVLTYKLVSLANTVKSVNIAPNAYMTIYKVNLATDSIAFKAPVIGTSYLGDIIKIVAIAPSGTPAIKFYGSTWITAGTATLSTKLRAVITFIFDGTNWVETGRLVQ